MKIACVIPARLLSSRLAKKVLLPIEGKPLLHWVIEAAQKISLFDQVVVATDHPEVAEIAEIFNTPCYLTSPDCMSGTDRLLELKQRGLVTADIWVNWQGDEPFVTSKMISQLLQTAESDPTGIWTLCKKITDFSQLYSPHIVKVVCNEQGQALYFSRALIPYAQGREEKKIYYKHIGLYAFSDQALERISSLKPTTLEMCEKLEQLRFLGHGLTIRVHETFEDPLGINTAEDLDQARQIFAQMKVGDPLQIS